MPYELPPLPYSQDALAPHLDGRTMEFHYGKHHAAYVTNLNKALEKYPDISRKPIETVLRQLDGIPADVRQAVINNGGGHFHHTFFWNIMGPKKGGQPRGNLADDIRRTFGSFDAFKDQFSKASLARFGSGWAWLCFGPDGKLHICDTLNQDSPVSKGHAPLLTVDVWEHAYYLQYQNRRADWVAAWWNLVNWDAVADLYAAAKRA
jgi:Fe-Mn family superoxide dismutase